MPAAYEIDMQISDRASYGIGLAPSRITTAIRKRAYVERNKFVGNRKKKKVGSFTRSVRAMRLRTRIGNVSSNVAGIFKGYLKGGSPTDINNMSLKMGVLPDSPKPFVKGIIELQHGFTRSTSKFMPIPVYDNLAKIGITGNFYNNFTKLADADEIVTIRQGGQVLFISKDLIDEGNDIFQSTLFIGVKRVRVGAMNFKFYEKANAQFPGMLKRLQSAINREIRSVEKGYVGSK